MPATTTSNPTLDIASLRQQFPVLLEQVNGHPLTYLDNAATTQKPWSVIHRLETYYCQSNANIHRGIHTLAERATHDFEQTRKAMQSFLNAREAEEIIFTKGTTESINLLAQCFGRSAMSKGDEILISALEHHSNIVPWQLIAEHLGLVLKVIPVHDNGVLDQDAYASLLSDRTKLVSITYVSNALGTVNPVEEMISLAHKSGAKVMIDAAQAAAHLSIDVQELDCDFLALSAHKMYGPTGLGILYGKRELLEAMPPYQGGGEMIREVRFDGTTFNDIPYKFEAGTPHIAGVVAFIEAIRFIEQLDRRAVWQHEEQLQKKLSSELSSLKRVTLIGTAPKKAGVVSFVVDGIHHFDLGMMLDARGIAIRTGHHCTQPLMDRLGIEGTNRASFSVYNTEQEVDYFVESLASILSKL